MVKRTIGPDGRPHAFIDLAPEKFPVVLTAFVGDEVLFQRTIEPYSVLDIPGPAPEHIGRIRVRLVFGDGEVIEHEPER
jgi:hypothetical protein